MNNLPAAIPLSPLFGALLIGVFGQFFQPRISAFVANISVFIAFLFALVFWYTGLKTPIQQTLYDWMHIGAWQPKVSLYLDRLSLVMVTVATGVGFLIHLFSVRFMAREEGERRYFFYLNLFVAGMLFFVMAADFIPLYLGWEVMGLCSYALIAFYYQKSYNAFCGRKAFVVTRIGDCALVMVIVFAFAYFGTLDIGTFLHLVQHSHATGILTLLALLLLLAGMAKSAQFPLHIWLPDAMTGPSPVSALIHAATMVTAGVYLIARFHALFNLVPDVRTLVAFVGLVTACYAASCALAQTSIKRVLAYSTISQVGYMFIALGINAYALAIFHLLVHACFKALLFMGSGVIGKSYEDAGDISKMGGLYKKQPLFALCFLIGCLTLSALPLVTASFYSKDAIITASTMAPQGAWIVAGGLLGSVLTALYSLRLYLLVFADSARSPIRHVEIYLSMIIPLALLALLSIGLGLVQFPENWSLGFHLWVPWLGQVLGAVTEPSMRTQFILQILGALTALLGIGLAFLAVRYERQGKGLNRLAFLVEAWFVDRLLTRLGGGLVCAVRCLCHWLETRLLMDALVNGLCRVFVGSGRLLSAIQGGGLRMYLCLMVMGALLLFGYVLGMIF